MIKIGDIVDEKVIKIFGDEYIKILTDNLLKAGKEASGNLIRSLDWRMAKTADTVQMLIEGEEYLLYVDRGRRPGKFPPISAIESWCRIKGINQKAAFPIAKNIFKFGIPPTNVIEKSRQRILKGPFVGLDIVSENIEQKFFELLVAGASEIKRIKK
jgi:hypothetical protein